MGPGVVCSALGGVMGTLPGDPIGSGTRSMSAAPYSIVGLAELHRRSPDQPRALVTLASVFSISLGSFF